MSVHQTYDGRWICTYRDENGNRHDKSFCRDEVAARAFDEAQKALKAERLKKYAPIEHVPLKEDRDSGITLKQAVEKYVKNLYATARSRVHMKTIIAMAQKHLYPFFGEERPIGELTYDDDIVPFIAMLRSITYSSKKKPLSEITVNRYCCYLKAIFNYAVKNGFIDRSPMRVWKKSSETSRQFQLTPEDVEKIMMEAPEHVRWGMELTYTLGVRPGSSELLSLQWKDINWNTKTITVYATKTKKFRTIPLTDQFIEKLRQKKAVAQTPYLMEYRGRPLRRINKAFRMAVERAGITYPVRLYDFRHMFATYLLNNGADLAAVSNMMGHSTITTTVNVYYQVMDKEKQRAVNLLPTFPSGKGNVA